MAPVTATFIASFDSFYSAVDKAVVELKSFEKETENVGKAMSRMGDSFSGRKVIQDATMMVEAIEQIGGVSKLTDAELARVGKTVEEASSKMRKLGLEVPASFQSVADAAKPVEKNVTLASRATDLLTSSFAQLTAAFSIGSLISQGVSGLMSWTSAAIASAGTLVDMSAKTGISIEEIQRMGYVADQTGTTLEAFTDAAFKLSVRIDGGSGSVRESVKALGLEYQALKTMSPEQQFNTIAAALEKIEDPTERNRLAVELFGKSASAILPAIAQGYTKIASEAKVSSDAQVKAIDDATGAWDRFKTNTKTSITSFLGNLILAADGMRGLTDAQREQVKSMIASGEAYDTAVAKVRRMRGDIVLATETTKETTKATVSYSAELKRLGPIVAEITRLHGAEIAAAMKLGVSQEVLEDKFGMTAEMLRVYQDQQREATKAETDRIAAAKEAAKQQEALDSALDKSVYGLRLYVAGLHEIPKALLAIPTTLIPARDAMNDFTLKALTIENVGHAWQTAAKDVATEGHTFNETLSALSDSLGQVGDQWTNVAQGMTMQMANVQRLWAGGFKTQAIGQAAGAIGAMIPATDSLGNSMARGALNGAAMGAVFGPIGMGVGAAAGAIMAYVDNSKSLKEVNHARQAFIEAHGGLALYHQELVATLGTQGEYLTQNLLHAQTAGGLEQAHDAITAALNEQDAAMNTLTETAQRYGFTLEELGPTMQRQELDKYAQQLYKDWEVLNTAGIDTVAITTRMAESVNAYVNQALAMGTEVPEAMRPMLEAMAASGQLLDANGNKIENLEDSGLSFSMSMSKGFQALITEVSKLTDAIARGLGVAVESTSERLARMPRSIPVDIIYKDPGFSRTHDVEVIYHGQPPQQIEGFQEGTHGKFVDFGSESIVALHGREAVVPEHEAGSLVGAAGGGGAPIVINIDARGALFNDPGSDLRLAARIDQALSAKHGLTNKRRAA